MRNLFAKLLVLTLFVVVAGTVQGIAQPQALDDPPQCIIDQDGTSVAAVIISVDDLQGEEHYYASLSADPQYEFDPIPEMEEGETLVDYAKRNWEWLITAFIFLLEIIVRLTPSEKDNTILSRLIALLGKLIPNMKKGGGTHTAST
nr:hypothetical protein [uncultured Draconibacterium sp.]